MPKTNKLHVKNLKMKMKNIVQLCLLLTTLATKAQTDTDALMMSKNNLCIGAVYQNSNWKEYWEGTFKRENLNMGKVSTASIGLMGNYGITDKLNFIFSVPYVQTKTSEGSMKGQKGFQDVSLTAKYMPLEINDGANFYSLYLFGSYTMPISNYTADYLPLSIGLESKTITTRIMADMQRGNLFTTLSGAYVKRFNINIDRDSYITNELHFTNEVNMPDVILINFRFGYRSERLIAEATFDNMVTQAGGFDITKNNMPFPSNTMNAIKLGTNFKYTLQSLPNLSIIGGYNYVTKGRNLGASNAFYGGVFYIVNFK